MKIYLTRHRDKWWKFWISRKPRELKEGKDYTIIGGRVILKTIPRNYEVMEVTYEFDGKVSRAIII